MKKKTTKQLRDKAYARHDKFRLRHPDYMKLRMRKMRRDVPGYDLLTHEQRDVLTAARAALKAARS